MKGQVSPSVLPSSASLRSAPALLETQLQKWKRQIHFLSPQDTARVQHIKAHVRMRISDAWELLIRLQLLQGEGLIS